MKAALYRNVFKISLTAIDVCPNRIF